MAIKLDYPHIETPSDGSARLARLPRIRVAQIALDYLAHGWSADEMCRQHPYLTPAEAHVAMAYYFDHQTEVDEEIRRELDQVRQSRAAAKPSPVSTRLRAKGLL